MSAALAQPLSAKLALNSASNKGARLVIPSAADNDRANARLKIIEPYLDAKQRKRLPKGFSSLTELARSLAAKAHISERQFFEWLKRYEKSGFILGALANKVYSNRGATSLSKEAQFIAWHAYHAQKLSAFQTYQEVRRAGHQCGYGSVRRFLQSESNVVTILTREGETAYNEKVRPYGIRQAPPVMHTWIGDGMKSDLWVLNDLFDEKRGEAVRLVLSAFMDFGSRKIVGFCFCMESNADVISSALAMGLAPFGKPQALYIDNGKDYSKIGKFELSVHASGVARQLDIEVVHSEPYNAQSKAQIERWFGTFHEQFDKLWPTYCGPLPTERPELCDELLHQHTLYRKGKADKSPLPLASEYIAAAKCYIEEVYNGEHKHSSLKGRTPNEVFDAAYPVGQRQSIEPRLLYPLLWDRQERRVTEGGCVQLYNARYEPDEASFGALLSRLGENVLIACDPYNLGEAVALDKDGHFLGVLRAQKLLEQGATTKDDFRALRRRKRDARRAINDYIQAISQAAEKLGVPDKLERIRLRATGTDTRRAAPGARLELPPRREFKTEAVFNDDAAAGFRAAMAEGDEQ